MTDADRCRWRTGRYVQSMSRPGTRIDEPGTLIWEGETFVMRHDVGGRYLLELHRVPVNHVAKRVRITGTFVADGLVSVDAVAPG